MGFLGTVPSQKVLKRKALMGFWSLTLTIKLVSQGRNKQVQSISLCSLNFKVVLCRETFPEKHQKDLDCEDSDSHYHLKSSIILGIANPECDRKYK